MRRRPLGVGGRHVAELLADGTLKVPVKDLYGLDEAPEALQALATGHTQGNLAIRVA